MNNTLWFYSDTQQTYGPIAAAQLITMIQAGQLVAGHFIMPQGAQEWQYVSASPFAGHLPQAAPPAPVAAPSPPQSPQRVAGQPYRPPQQRAAAPAPRPQAVKKSRGGLIATAVVLLLSAGMGAYFWFKPATTMVTNVPAPTDVTATVDARYAEDRTVLIRGCIFGVSKDDATALLADKRLESNPKEMVKALQRMVMEKRASIIATPCMTTVVNPCWTTGTYWYKADLVFKRDEEIKLAHAIYNFKKNGDPRGKGTPAEWRVTDVPVRRGKTTFLGSFEDNSLAGSAEPVRIIFASFN